MRLAELHSPCRRYFRSVQLERDLHDPEALASALQKISDPKLIRQFQRGEMMPDMQPAFSHLYIVNHFSGRSVLNWFSTHPPVMERVKRLLALKGNG